MKTQADEIFSSLERQLKRNMLRWHVGQVIFCPACGGILDFRRAVEIDVLQAGKLVKSMVVCAGCFDGKVKDNAKGMLQELSHLDLALEITDGRQFGRPTAASIPEAKA